MGLHLAKYGIGLCCTVCLMVGPAVAESNMVAKAPLERQVFQRNKDNQARVAVSGSTTGDVDVVEAKAILNAGATNGQPVGWTVVASGDVLKDGNFAGTLTLEAGGWYTISIRARRGKVVVGEVKIMKVGIGDVFITAGQSNSANYGKPRQVARDDRVVYFDGKQFVPARDPIPGGAGGGGSAWPILGDMIVKSQGVPVCFRSATQTWTEVKNWEPGAKFKKYTLYKNLVKCAGEFRNNGIRAVLWHQGESDSLAKTPAKTYAGRLKNIIDSLNKDAGHAIPWFVAQASFHPQSKMPEEAEVAKGQKLLWKMGVAHRGPVTDDLGNDHRHDGVHFNQRGLTTHARRWFGALSSVYKWKAPPSN